MGLAEENPVPGVESILAVDRPRDNMRAHKQGDKSDVAERTSSAVGAKKYMAEVALVRASAIDDNLTVGYREVGRRRMLWPRASREDVRMAGPRRWRKWSGDLRPVEGEHGGVRLLECTGPRDETGTRSARSLVNDQASHRGQTAFEEKVLYRAERKPHESGATEAKGILKLPVRDQSMLSCCPGEHRPCCMRQIKAPHLPLSFPLPPTLSVGCNCVTGLGPG